MPLGLLLIVFFDEFLILAIAGLGIQAAARALRPAARGRPALGWALAAIGGPGSTAGPVVLSLVLGLSVLAAVGQIDQNLRGAIARDLPDQAPSFFFVDIQSGDVDAFADLVQAELPEGKLIRVPMLRGRVMALNDVDVRELQVPPEGAWSACPRGPVW